MFPFQPIDVSKLSFATLIDIVAPMVPGGTIALGWLCSHESFWTNLHDERTAKIAIAIFVTYVVGFVVFYLTAFELGGAAFLWLIRTTEINEPWKNSEWRKVAAKFLGAELSSPTEEPSSAAVEVSQAINAINIAEALNENHTKILAVLNFQSQWQKWYEILKYRFPNPPNPSVAAFNAYLFILNSIGWSGLVSAYISNKHVSWHIWVGCGLTIAVSHLFFVVNFRQQQYPDPSGDRLAAEILKEIEGRERASNL